MSGVIEENVECQAIVKETVLGTLLLKDFPETRRFSRVQLGKTNTTLTITMRCQPTALGRKCDLKGNTGV